MYYLVKRGTELKDGFYGTVLSSHRTLDAMKKADAMLQAQEKKQFGAHEWIWTVFTKGKGQKVGCVVHVDAIEILREEV